ncbi:MFS transporter [Azospirillum picis]|uniref:DHA2 family multidrug resistance protein-like MFS transporter n=1 Tax=Azospirillum picis TaxID=488438 RepID=A0ABU0MJ95_9PROT|nr:MFS transporter [Azospirillum picis]MBP2299717.1 DHA2 family multidrug resistance protein-like MFS transporter [Azospirillum picis]MDQ0533513.1 DHA2 family multidrug resistance protein-like MFS transporter [Azospirillum picis]
MPQPAAPPSPPSEALPIRRRIAAVASILTAIVLVVLDGAVANIALPTIADTLGVAPADSVWVITGYQLALVVALLPAGALGERLGYRTVFAGGVLLFTAASAGCALAPTLPWLVAARLMQGLGGAAVMALAVALLRFVYPPRLLGAAIGWNALVIALSSAAGPTVGAAILAVAPWPFLFAVNIPIGAIVLLTARALPAVEGMERRIDPVSVALNAGFFAALVIGAETIASRLGLGAALMLAAAACLAGLIRRERGQEAPLVPLDLLRDRSFRLSVVASVLCFTGQMASTVALPFYLQHGLGQDAFTAGLFLVPWPLATAVAAPIAGRLSDRLATGWLCASGGVLLAAGLALSAIWPLGRDPLPLLAFMVISGFGFGLFQTPNNRNMLLTVPKARSGAAGGMQGTARLVGQTAGAVIMTLLFSLVSSPVDAPRTGLAVAAALTLAGGLASLLRVPARAGAAGLAAAGAADAPIRNR